MSPSCSPRPEPNEPNGHNESRQNILGTFHDHNNLSVTYNTRSGEIVTILREESVELCDSGSYYYLGAAPRLSKILVEDPKTPGKPYDALRVYGQPLYLDYQEDKSKATFNPRIYSSALEVVLDISYRMEQRGHEHHSFRVSAGKIYLDIALPIPVDKTTQVFEWQLDQQASQGCCKYVINPNSGLSEALVIYKIWQIYRANSEKSAGMLQYHFRRAPEIFEPTFTKAFEYLDDCLIHDACYKDFGPMAVFAFNRQSPHNFCQIATLPAEFINPLDPAASYLQYAPERLNYFSRNPNERYTELFFMPPRLKEYGQEVLNLITHTQPAGG